MFWAAVRKDIRLLRRDRGALLGLFALPVLFIVVFGHVLGVDPAKAEWAIAVHHESGSRHDDAVVRAIAAVDASANFRVTRASSASDVRDAVAAGDVRLGLIFTPDFDPDVGRPAELVIDEAGARELRAPLEGALEAIVGSAVAGRERPMRVLRAATPPQVRPVGHTDGFQLAVPGNAVLFCFFLSVTVALSFIGERRTGTWRRILAAPVGRRTLLLAKLVPYFLVGLAQMAVFFAIGIVGFGMEVGGSPIALVVLTALVCLCAVSLGLALATIATTEKQVGGIGSLLVLTMGLVGGCMYPRIGMPLVMQKVGLAVPHGWALDGYYTVLIRAGSGITDIALELGALAAFTAAFLAFGIARFRFEG